MPNVLGTMGGARRSTVTARFGIELPEDAWIAEISRTFPETEFRLLAGYPTDQGAVHLGEAVTATPDEVSEAIAAHPAILEYRRLHATDDRSLARYEAEGTGLYAFVEQTGLVVDYPVTVSDGWFVVEFIDSRERFDDFRAGLEASDRRFELRSVVEAVERRDFLTARQQEVLEAAFRAGYFEVPRDSTLAAVADDLGVDTSTASETLRRAQARLVEYHLSALRE